MGVPINPPEPQILCVPPPSVTGLHDLDEYIQAQLLLAVSEDPPPKKNPKTYRGEGEEATPPTPHYP